MNAIVKQDHDHALRDALKSSLYPGASDDSVRMVLSYCQAAGLDPMTKPVHIVPIWMAEKKDGARIISPAGMRDVVMPGIELYRTKAHRTGEYAGQDEAAFGPTIEALGIRYPEWCRVTVYRLVAGVRVPYSAKAYWLESYATAKRDTDAPNAMWRKRPFGQIEKCAEALALRKAFPESVGAQPTAEEMEGREIPPDGAVPRLEVVKPERAAYPDADFDKNLASWRKTIDAGKKTADDIIAMVETKGALSDAQKAAIRGVKPEAIDDAEIIEQGDPA